MITVSPNRVGKFAQCPSAAGYYIVSGDKSQSSRPALVRGRKRGTAIHLATFGEAEGAGAGRGGTRVGGGSGGGSGVTAGGFAGGKPVDLKGHWLGEYPPELAQVDAEIIWTAVQHWWPNTEWRTEIGMTTQLTPNIMLEGRLDLLGCQAGRTWILPDLKTSTGYTSPHPDGQSDDLDKQLILYARLVRDHVTEGVLPQIWRVGFNPNTKRPTRRQYPLSDMLVEQASRYAVHVACSIERMHSQHPLEWLRSMQCSTPFPCPYKLRCARDCGAWYTDGVHGAPTSDPDSDPTSGGLDDDPLAGDDLPSGEV